MLVNSTVRRTLAALGAATMLGIAAPSMASAAVIDQDGVSASISGNSLSGYVNWTSYYGGSGQVTVKNDMTDGVCATAQQRVYRGGAWSAWNTIVILCTQQYYTANVWITSNGQPVTYWQFRIADARSDWATDTNSPGGA